MNDTYPYATMQLLQPEVRTEPVIDPVLAILHTHGAKGTSQAVGRYFARQDVKVESTVSLPRTGGVVQFQYLDRQADANAAANGWTEGGRLLGAWSIETEDLGDPRIPLTPEQCSTASLFLAHGKDHYGLDLERARAVGRGWRGVGHHSLFDRWNPNNHSCPGPVRERQLYEQLLPGALWLVAAAAASKVDRTEIVDELATPDGDGTWRLQRDGGVFTTGRARFYGSYPGLPAAHRAGNPDRLFAIITPYKRGYAVVTDAKRQADREWYHFPAPTARTTPKAQAA